MGNLLIYLKVINWNRKSISNYKYKGCWQSYPQGFSITSPLKTKWQRDCLNYWQWMQGPYWETLQHRNKGNTSMWKLRRILKRSNKTERENDCKIWRKNKHSLRKNFKRRINLSKIRKLKAFKKNFKVFKKICKPTLNNWWKLKRKLNRLNLITFCSRESIKLT